MINKVKKYKMSVLIWGTVAVFTVLYISLIFSNNIWTDEAFTIQLLKENLQGIISGTAKDVHPPLYYIYLKAFVKIFGNSLISMKIASVIPLTGTLLLGATIIRKRFGDITSFLYVLFFACVPCSMEFSVQVRMYSLAVFFVTLCGIYAYNVFIDGRFRDYLIAGISGVLAAYTHYFAFMPVIIIMAFLFISIIIWNRKRILSWIIMAVGMIVSYMPWFPSFYRQVTSVNAGYWIPEISAEYVWGYFTWTFDLTLIPGTVFIFLILLKAVSTYNIINISKHYDKDDIYALMCMLAPTVTMILGVIISVCSTPIYRNQYIFPSLALLSLFFGIVLRKTKKIFLVLISIFLIFVGCVQYKECYHQEYESTYLPQTEEFLKANMASDDIIVYNYEIFGFIYEVQFETKFPDAKFEYLENFDFSQDFNAIWFFDSEWQPDIDPAVLEDNGLVMEYAGHYGVEHNEFDIYKIYRQ